MRATRGNIVCRPRPDIHEELVGISLRGGEITSDVFGRVNVGSTLKYDVTGERNNFVFAEVVDVGKGNIWGPDSAPLPISRGDIIGHDLCECRHEYRNKGETEWFLPFAAAICVFKHGQARPIGNWVMTQEDLDAQSSLMTVNPEGQRIVIPGQHRNGIKSRKHGNMRMTVERIVAAGNGARIGKVFHLPECLPGSLAAFTSFLSVDLRAYSVNYRFTQWEHFIATFSDEE